MALFIVRLMAVLTLAISVGGCAQKRVVPEVPEQPEPSVVSSESPNFETAEEHRARQKRIAEAEEEQRRNTLERKIKETRETEEQRKERLEMLKESELEAIVFKPTFEEQQILARAQEIEVEEARKKAQKAKQQGDTPAIQQARREAQELRRKQERIKKEAEKGLREARLTGCDPASIDLLPLDQRFDPFAIFPSTLRVRIVNQGSNPVNIDTSFRGYGQLVGNLCGGGAINVTFRLNAWEPSQQVPLTVTTKLPNGRVVTEMRFFWIQKSIGQQWIWNDTWPVNLDNR